MADPEHPALEALRARLAEEESAYAEVLAAIDRLSMLALPTEVAPEIREKLAELNALWSQPPAHPAGGALGVIRRQARERAGAGPRAAAGLQRGAGASCSTPTSARPSRSTRRLRELAGALVRYAQRVEPVVDARDRVATALATTRSELLLEAFDRRLESLARRLDTLPGGTKRD